MDKRRVLIVDDSVLVRQSVSQAMADDADLEASVASSGPLALSKIDLAPPDCILLDAALPPVEGVEIVARIRSQHPGIPVILYAEPADKEDLKARVREACHLPPKSPGGKSPPQKAARIAALRPGGIVDLVVIGVSTGGPNALAALVPAFPRDFAVPVLIVQHMPPMFTKLLAERLAGLCPLRCREAEEGEVVGPGDLRLAPGNRHMTVMRKEGHFQIHLNQDALENSCRPSVDVLFRHAAACAQNHVLAVMLTGMGQDGLRGSEAIKSEGGSLLAQDEATSVVWGMPGAVTQAGLPEKVLPLAEIGPEIVRRVRGGRN